VFLGEDRSSPLDGFPWGFDQDRPSALIVLVHQWEAGFLQGVTLRRGVALSQGFLTASLRFPFTDRGANPGRGLRQSPLGLGRGCSFFKAFRISLFSRITSRQGVLAVAFLF
jgi:hypothetical protein